MCLRRGWTFCISKKFAGNVAGALRSRQLAQSPHYSFFFPWVCCEFVPHFFQRDSYPLFVTYLFFFFLLLLFFCPVSPCESLLMKFLVFVLGLLLSLHMVWVRRSIILKWFLITSDRIKLSPFLQFMSHWQWILLQKWILNSAEKQHRGIWWNWMSSSVK